MIERQSKGVIQMIPLNAIKVTDLNIRKSYEEESLAELGQSFSQLGILHPIVVRRSQKAGEYELILGSRRLRAAQQLRLARISATILDKVDDPTVIVMALSENLQREDLTPFEESWALLKLINEYKMNLQAVAKRTGKSEHFIRRRLQLLSMPQEVQNMVARRELNIAQASNLARVANPDEQIELARVAVKGKLSDKEFNILIHDQLKGKIAPPRKVPQTKWTGQRLTLQIKSAILLIKRVLPEVVPTIQGKDAIDLYKAIQELERELMKAKKSLETK